MRFSSEYKNYIQSSAWKAKSLATLKRANYRCQICGAYGVRLQSHHNNYDNLGHEKEGDLIAVCDSCHNFITWFIRLRRWYKRVFCS